MTLFLEVMVVFTVAILPQIAATIFISRDPAYLESLSPGKRSISSLIGFVAYIVLIVYVAANRPGGLSSVGLTFTARPAPISILVAATLTAYLLLIFLVGRLRSKEVQQRRETLRRSVFEAGGFSKFKSLPERCAYLIGLWTGVIAEDLVYRGYLVLGLASSTGILWPWIILSMTLSVVIHLYQGRDPRLMLGQAVFALLFIGAVVVTGSVIAAIIPHLAYDTIWFLRGWAIDDKVSMAQPLSEGR
ncbi:MAG TPA: CPBP family intramembrane glutamic endopeptidase [Anaerolineales bacterium]